MSFHYFNMLGRALTSSQGMEEIYQYARPKDAMVGQRDPWLLGILTLFTAFLGWIVIQMNASAAAPLAVLSLFLLCFYLIIDSSPDTFGLAMMTGLEACSFAVGPHGFLDLAAVPPEVFRTGSDVFELYFFLQLARTAKPAAAHWLLTAFGFGMCWLGIFGPGSPWAAYGPSFHGGAQVAIAVCGMVLLGRTLVFLHSKRLPWRKAALSLAFLVAAGEFVNLLMGETRGVWGYAGASAAALPFYLFTLSNFLNISTLERRVKTLSEQKSRTAAMEKDLELARSVQQAFLAVPELPPDLKLTYHHEAAVYVSGDSYLVHWEEERDVLTFLLSDVTGHGVQAALKAFACNVVARSLWTNEKDANLPQIASCELDPAEKLKTYDRLVENLVCRAGRDDVAINSMVGATFDRRQGELSLYRANYTFPLLGIPHAPADPKGAVTWTTKALQTGNQQIIRRQLVPGSIVILISDGYLENPRERTSYLRYVQRILNDAGARPSPTTVKDQTLKCPLIQSKSKAAEDDRTFVIFQWGEPIANAGGKGDEPQVS